MSVCRKRKRPNDSSSETTPGGLNLAEECRSVSAVLATPAGMLPLPPTDEWVPEATVDDLRKWLGQNVGIYELGAFYGQLILPHFSIDAMSNIRIP